MPTIKTKGLIDSDGEEFVFVPPAPEGDDLGGISATDVAQITQNASDVHDLQVQNLLNPTKETTTANGVTLTNNGDGTYTLNGTSTSTSVFYFKLQENVRFSSGTYKLIGRQSEDASALSIRHGGSSGVSTLDLNDGAVGELNNDIDYNVCVRINVGHTCNNELIKPMLTYNLNTTYDDFKPYSESFAYGSEITNLNNALTKKDISSLFTIRESIRPYSTLKAYELSGFIYICFNMANSTELISRGNYVFSTSNTNYMPEFPLSFPISGDDGTNFSNANVSFMGNQAQIYNTDGLSLKNITISICYPKRTI